MWYETKQRKKLHTKLKHKFMIQSKSSLLMSVCLWLNGIMVVSNKKKEKEEEEEEEEAGRA